ncbi:MAG: type II secretion system protein GspG [Planctomycetota bacterium]
MGASFFSAFALVTLAVPNVLPSSVQSKGGEKPNGDIVSIEAAAKQFALNNGGKWPDSLEVLVTPDVNGKRYLDQKELPKDAWGRVYRYDPRPRIYSLGRDGVVGGTGEDADVDNRDMR